MPAPAGFFIYPLNRRVEALRLREALPSLGPVSFRRPHKNRRSREALRSEGCQQRQRPHRRLNRSASPLASGPVRSASLSRTPEKHRAGGQQHSEALRSEKPSRKEAVAARRCCSLRFLRKRFGGGIFFRWLSQPEALRCLTLQKSAGPGANSTAKRFALKSPDGKKWLRRIVAARCAPCGSASVRRLGQVEALRWRDFFLDGSAGRKRFGLIIPAAAFAFLLPPGVKRFAKTGSLI